MKKPSAIMIHATKVRGVGDFPGFIHLGHRHLQKEMSTYTVVGDVGVKEFVLPLDLIRITVNPALVNNIEEVRLAYFKRG